MAEISAKQVMELRKKTGCGMMECKKALVEANGDFEEATKLLREKGLAVAAKKANRVAAEGLVDIEKCEKCGYTAMVEVNSESDFVAKNDQFKGFVKSILATILKNKPADIAALMSCTLEGTENTVEAELKDKIFTIGENLTIRRFELISGVTGTYIHGGGAAGVIVKFETTNGIENTDAFKEYAKNICMQIAAMSPLYVAPADVPESVIDGEKEIILTQIKNDPKFANKPAAVVEKMVTGRVSKYYDTNCLDEQQYVRDEALKVKAYTQNTAKELGGDIKIVSFVKYERGEGIEKVEEDYAAEIAKLAGGGK